MDVYIIFYVILVLSLVFTLSSLSILALRKRNTLKIPAAVWIALFLISLIPFFTDGGILDISVYRDYTGGVEVEVNGEFFDGTSELFIPHKAVVISKSIVTGLVSVWFLRAFDGFLSGVFEYWNNLRRLTKLSKECRDTRICRIFDRAKAQVGIKRHIGLRIVDPDFKVSPCTCGTIFPTVYISEDYIYDYSDTWMEYVFLHEITHVKNNDGALKLIALLATSFFSFLPVSKRVSDAIYEDSEYICDKTVLKAKGIDVSHDYMNMLINIAERSLESIRNPQKLLSDASVAGEFLMKRYNSMNSREPKKITYTMPCLIAAALINILFMTSFSISDSANLGVTIKNPLVREAVCAYFGIDNERKLTEQLLCDVYSIEFKLSERNDNVKRFSDGKYALSCVINEGFVWDGEKYTPPIENMPELALNYDVYPAVIREDMFDIIYPDSEKYRDIRSCYYTILSSADGGTYYVFNDECMDVADEYIQNQISENGLSTFISETMTVDVRDLELFGELRTVIFSDNLQASDREIYSSDEFAVIKRH